ncbi:hypothetical protein SAMN03159423_2819 [Bradyrhizobium sp. NFR13]|uniref:hypothetical protein n=1 Tax=Bradyrhizobium sp. NFR13 TaxID=1566285 RepID=UPI0008E8C279|nr:hypothetical protein [Bradyrhizobium sp. NFR13]SFL61127.1 hypothetical protein SAMN03159423_2819 [Bradyrhizobium sp. NFR13]
MGTGNNDVGKDTPIGAPGRPLISTVRPRTECQGAMSQQGYGSHGHECYPQKLVQLVGYRSPQSQESWDRLRTKRTITHPAE